MHVKATVTFTEEELRAVYAALCDRTSRVLAEEGADSPRLAALREARAQVAEKLAQCPQVAALAA